VLRPLKSTGGTSSGITDNRHGAEDNKHGNRNAKRNYNATPGHGTEATGRGIERQISVSCNLRNLFGFLEETFRHKESVQIFAMSLYDINIALETPTLNPQDTEQAEPPDYEQLKSLIPP